MPARDEEEEIEGCLESIVVAVEAVGLPVVATGVLHRCTDGTADHVNGGPTGAAYLVEHLG